MSNVVQLKPKEVPEPHGQGAAFCMGCGNEWQAVVPVGTTSFECPKCFTHHGHFKFPFAPPTNTVWTCNCENQFFNVTEAGIFCPKCGHYQEFP